MMHPWHLHGMPMRVVARDGYPLGSAAFTCDTLGVNPGERWDVIVDCDEPGAWAFHCHILPHVEGTDGMFGMVTALVIQAPASGASSADPIEHVTDRHGGACGGVDRVRVSRPRDRLKGSLDNVGTCSSREAHIHGSPHVDPRRDRARPDRLRAGRGGGCRLDLSARNELATRGAIRPTGLLGGPGRIGRHEQYA